MKRISMDTPTVLSFSTEEMSQERDALLLECGIYPDKGLSVTEADLDGIVARFSADGAPIKVEHMDTPLDPLGRVQRIWREGSTLMAKLLFPEDLAGFLRRRGVQKLSVGLSREAVGLALTEVSLVLKPRVAAAAMFSDPTPGASADPSLGGKGEELFGEEGAEGRGAVVMGEDARDAEIGRLRAALGAREVEGQIAALKAAGRVVPATEALVRALLSTPGESRITLAEGAGPVAVREVFLSYLQAQPPVVQFGEMALPGGAAGSATGPQGSGAVRTHHHALGDLPALTADEEEFLRKLGLEPAAVQHVMRHGKLPAK